MSLHGNFERLDRGFEFPKGEFGKGKFRLKYQGQEVRIEDGDDHLASIEIDHDADDHISQAEFELLQELQDADDGCLFLEVIGGADYLKDFLEKIIDEEPRSN
ncbi:MAG: hypothetical protein ABEK04_00350 [Candidatus Nanohalobium sp.]